MSLHATSAATPPTITAPRANSEPVLEVDGLEKQYGSIHAVNGLSLEVRRGEIYGFLGPNGAGKTTTIRMLMGLIKPSKGEIKLFGQSLAANRSSVLARVGSLVESPSAYSHLTGWENLELTRRLLAAPRDRIALVLAQVGLTDAAHRVVREYSLGMKGRLAVANALLGRPELLILDEPTNGLDPSGIREMRDFLRRLPDQGVTVLVSSHLLSEIEQLAGTVGIIAAGKMRFEGTLEALRARFQNRLLLQVSDTNRALGLLKVHKPVHTQTGWLELNAEHAQAANINRLLLEAGIDVSHLEVTRPSLEQIFLELTEGDAA